VLSTLGSEVPLASETIGNTKKSKTFDRSCSRRCALSIPRIGTRRTMSRL